MKVRSERGEGKLANFFWLVILAAGGYAGWNVIPVYIANYGLADKMNEVARAPKWSHPDEKIMDMLVKDAGERGLHDYVSRQNFRVLTLDTSRRITCEYDREVEILPGWKHVFHFRSEVNQPLI